MACLEHSSNLTRTANKEIEHIGAKPPKMLISTFGVQREKILRMTTRRNVMKLVESKRGESKR